MLILGLLLRAWAGEALGPLPPGTTLLEQQSHPEFLRYHLQAEREFWIELTPTRPDTKPVCQGGGADLWVRTTLDGPESFEWDPLPGVVDSACAHIRLNPPQFPAPPPPVQVTEAVPDPKAAPVPEPPTRGIRPLQPLALLWAALLLWTAPRRWEPWAAGALALMARLLFSPRTVLLGGDAAYERLLSARAWWDIDHYYGDAWPSLMGLFAHFLPEVPDWVHGVNLGVSALTVAFAVGLAQRLGADRLAALGAGGLLALAPWPLRLAGMEDHFLWVSLLQLVALWGALGRDRAGAWLCALSLGLLVHLRPLQEPFALGVMLLLARDRRWPALALSLGLVAWRVLELLPMLREGAGAGIVGWSRYGSPSFWWRVFLPGPQNPDLHNNPLVTPLGLTVLGAVGLVALLARGRLAPAFVLVGALSAVLLPVLPKQLPAADPLRFQLPACAFWCILAGFGLSVLWELEPRRRLGLLLAMGLTLLPVWIWREPLWAWQEEYTLLQAWTLEVPEGQRVYFDGSQDPNGHFGEWLNLRSAGDWVAWNGPDAAPLVEGDWLYRGSADRLRGDGDPGQACDLERLREATISNSSDGWVDFGAEPLRVELLRVGLCRVK